ncbi:hypothetical protein NK8_52850 (plasmid) [Caballeronia sp. NK8]|nr:hypothetical protein NK8_52850 [Caballeronia sp. NK8]
MRIEWCNLEGRDALNPQYPHTKERKRPMQTDSQHEIHQPRRDSTLAPAENKTDSRKEEEGKQYIGAEIEEHLCVDRTCIKPTSTFTSARHTERRVHPAQALVDRCPSKYAE